MRLNSNSFPIGGERVTYRESNLLGLGRTKLTNSQGKQQRELYRLARDQFVLLANL